MKIKPLGPALVGQPVIVRARAWFWQQPGCEPPARVKARVFWNAALDTELLSEEMVETSNDPKDTLDVIAVLRSKTGECLNASVDVCFYYVIGGAGDGSAALRVGATGLLVVWGKRSDQPLSKSPEPCGDTLQARTRPDPPEHPAGVHGTACGSVGWHHGGFAGSPECL